MAEQHAAGFHLALGSGADPTQGTSKQGHSELRSSSSPSDSSRLSFRFQMMPVQQMAPMQGDTANMGFSGFPNAAMAAPQFSAAPAQPAPPQALMGVLNLLQQVGLA